MELGAEDTMSSPRAITRHIPTAEEEFTGQPSSDEAEPTIEVSPSAEEEFTGQPSSVEAELTVEVSPSAEEEFTGQPSNLDADLTAPAASAEEDFSGQASNQEAAQEYAAEAPPAEQSPEDTFGGYGTEVSGEYAEQEFVYEPAPGERREEAAQGAEAEPVAPAPVPPPSLPAWVTRESAPVEPAAEEHWAQQDRAVASYEAQQAASAAELPEVQPGFQPIAVPKLADLGPRLDYGQSTAAGPFHVGPEGLAVTVQGEMLCRLVGMVAVAGGVDAIPESRRNRGRAVDQPFGDGPAQLQRVKGHGTLYLEPGKGHFQAIDLDDEGCYLREERVFAFEEAVAFENGRLTSGQIAVDMVHLKGHGAVLLKLDGALKAMAVPAGTPLKVPLARLVGWYGQVSPRVMVGFVGQATVELTGEGYALLAAPG